MKLEHQVCTLEQAKRLRELGIKQHGLLYFAYDGKLRCRVDEYAHPLGGSQYALIIQSEEAACNPLTYSAFTVAELGVMLPMGFVLPKRAVAGQYFDRFQGIDYPCEAQARAGMLIALLVRGVITPAACNAALVQHVDNQQPQHPTARL